MAGGSSWQASRSVTSLVVRFVSLFAFFSISSNLYVRSCFLHCFFGLRFLWLEEQKRRSRSPDWQCNFTSWKWIRLSSFIMNNARPTPEQMKGRWGRRLSASVAQHAKTLVPNCGGNLLSRRRNPHWRMRTFILRSIDQLPACLVKNQVARI